MDVRQVGMGTCPKHGIAIMSSISEGGKGVCFACMEESKEKTGKTVVVKESSQDASGSVTLLDPKSQESQTVELRTAVIPKADQIVLSFSIDELNQDNLIDVIILKAYHAIDDVPVKTHGESKRLSAIQDHLMSLVASKPKQKRKYIKHGDSPAEKVVDQGTSSSSVPN